MAVQYALVESSGEVQHVVSSGADSDYVDGQTYDGLVAVQVSSETDIHTLIQSKYRHKGEWVSREPRSDQWQDWIDYEWAFNSERFWTHVRQERDVKLAQSDWTQLTDVTFDLGVKAAWITYRTALRNVPANNSDCVSINDIVWPVSP